MAKRRWREIESDKTSNVSIKDNSESHASTSEQGSCKLIQLDLDIAPVPVMHCSLPPHRSTLNFNTFEEYEVHYAKIHMNRCLECRKNFPTEHFLSLHLEENHNAIFTIKRERGEKMYACFVEDCDRRCSTPQKRRMHLIDKHLYPKDYDFFVVNHGIGNRTSMLKSWNRRIRGSSMSTHTSGMASNTSTIGGRKAYPRRNSLISNSKNDTEMDNLASTMSALQFVPSSIRQLGGRSK